MADASTAPDKAGDITGQASPTGTADASAASQPDREGRCLTRPGGAAKGQGQPRAKGAANDAFKGAFRILPRALPRAAKGTTGRTAHVIIAEEAIESTAEALKAKVRQG